MVNKWITIEDVMQNKHPEKCDMNNIYKLEELNKLLNCVLSAIGYKRYTYDGSIKLDNGSVIDCTGVTFYTIDSENWHRDIMVRTWFNTTTGYNIINIFEKHGDKAIYLEQIGFGNSRRRAIDNFMGCLDISETVKEEGFVQSVKERGFKGVASLATSPSRSYTLNIDVYRFIFKITALEDTYELDILERSIYTKHRKIKDFTIKGSENGLDRLNSIIDYYTKMCKIRNSLR